VSRTDRRKNLARRLALWSIADQIDHESVDKEVAKFSKVCSEDAEELSSIREKIASLKEKEQEIIKNMLSSCTENVQRLKSITASSVARPLVDLAFWNRMSDLNPDLYKIIHPHLDELKEDQDKKSD
jgi:hypothetical protein